jgi:DNA-binding transcriptional LysR family regulator
MTATEALDLNQVSAFVRVMETGSFTAAARTLGLPKSSVSRRVSALEKSLRSRLLQRGTRKLVLTEAGRLYFERARASLAGLAEANTAVTDMSKEIAGPIRFTAGGDNTGLIASLIGEFLGRYPKVQIDVVLTPRRVDLVNEGFDLALRAGPLVDSSLVVRRLGRSDHGLFASRAYLRKAGKPQRVSDLARHRFVLFGEPHEREHLRLIGPKGDETVRVQGPLVVHEMSFAADAIAGKGADDLFPVGVDEPVLPGDGHVLQPHPDAGKGDLLPRHRGTRGESGLDCGLPQDFLEGRARREDRGGRVIEVLIEEAGGEDLGNGRHVGGEQQAPAAVHFRLIFRIAELQRQAGGVQVPRRKTADGRGIAHGADPFKDGVRRRQAGNEQQ